MKLITKYQTDDGKVFDTETECQLHEQRNEIVDYVADDSDIYIAREHVETVIKIILRHYNITSK